MAASTDGFLFPELETERTRLRLLTTADTKAVFQHFSDEEVTRYLDIEPCRMLKEAREIIEFHEQDTGCRWGIFDRNTTQLIGTCGYHCWCPEIPAPEAEIGYDLARACWGKRLMQEVLAVVLQFGFTEMSLTRIVADPEPDNIRSLRLLNRMGFQPETTHRDGRQWVSLSKVDWLANSTE